MREKEGIRKRGGRRRERKRDPLLRMGVRPTRRQRERDSKREATTDVRALNASPHLLFTISILPEGWGGGMRWGVVGKKKNNFILKIKNYGK